jgi:hypothetical protein
MEPFMVTQACPEPGEGLTTNRIVNLHMFTMLSKLEIASALPRNDKLNDNDALWLLRGAV